MASRLGLGIPALLFVLAGCTDSVGAPVLEYGLFPKVAYSGFNSTATFKVMYATSAPNPTWTIDDPTIATIAPHDPPTIQGVSTKGLRFALVTTLKAGNANVTMTANGQRLTAQLQVKAYSNDDVTIGTKRYENPDPPNDATRPSCASCHQKPGGVDHSPLKMAGFDDPTILGVIQDGTYPANATGQSTTSDFAPTGPLTNLPAGVTHHWNLTDPEKTGILAHLRSLPLGGIQ
jgi:hypothetical protein